MSSANDTVEAIRANVDARLVEIQIRHTLILMDRGHSPEEAIRIVKDAVPVDVVNGMGGGGGGILGGLFGSISGARANGGPVSAGQAYLVGERRPEVFVPRQSGVIIHRVPTGGGRGGGTNVTFGPTTINGSGLSEEQIDRAISRSQVETLRQVPSIAVKSVQSYRNRVA